MDLKDGSGYAFARKQADALRAKINSETVVKNDLNNRGNPIQGIVIQEKAEAIECLINKRSHDFQVIKPVAMTGVKRVIDNRKYLKKDELQLPDKVLKLINNKMYLPRHKLLAREYGVKYLEKIADIANTKAKPQKWYQTVTSKQLCRKTGMVYWDQTYDMLRKMFERIEKTIGLMTDAGIAGVQGNKYFYYFYNATKNLSEAEIISCIELAKAKHTKDPIKRFSYEISNRLARLWFKEKASQLIAINAFK